MKTSLGSEHSGRLSPLAAIPLPGTGHLRGSTAAGGIHAFSQGPGRVRQMEDASLDATPTQGAEGGAQFRNEGSGRSRRRGPTCKAAAQRTWCLHRVRWMHFGLFCCEIPANPRFKERDAWQAIKGRIVSEHVVFVDWGGDATIHNRHIKLTKGQATTIRP